MRYKYRKTTFYVHNLGKFDAVFIIKELIRFNLTEEGKKNPYIIQNPTIRNSDILKIVIRRKVEGKVRTITLMDSYAILPSSLRKLCSDYKVDLAKSYFPYRFAISDNLFYKGQTPNYNYFEDVPMDVYNSFISEN